jgi:hypothetical protein
MPSTVFCDSPRTTKVRVLILIVNKTGLTSGPCRHRCLLNLPANVLWSASNTVLGPSHDKRMASLMTMPVELLLEIVRLILDDRLKIPAVGQDAAMVAPPNSQIMWNLQPTLKKRIIQRIPWIVWKNFGGAKRVQETVVVRYSHCNLKALRA